MGQYVKRSGKTYYKGDDGKLYKDYSAALAAANKPQTGFEYGLSLLGVRPDRSQQSGLEYGMKQLAGLAGIPGQPETGLQYGLQQAGNLFNRLARGANAAQLSPTDAQLKAEGYDDLVNDAARLRSPTDAQLRAEGYGDLVDDAARAKTPIVTPAGIVQPAAIVKGLTPAGTVDYTQGDEYKSQMAQYQNLIKQEKQAEAEDLGMKIWMDKYGGKLGLTGPNPLMEDFGGFVPTQGPTPAVLQASETPLKAFGQEVKTYFPGAGPESFNPIDAQDQQQEATATQADMATTAGMSAGDRARNLTRAFRLGLI